MSLLRLAAMDTGGAVFTDPDDLDPNWWIRGDLGITESSGVSLWENQATGGSSAGSTGDVSFGASYRPTATASNADFNSQSTVDFSSAGSGDVGATGDDWWDLITTNDDCTWIFVVQPTATGFFDLFNTESAGSGSGDGGWSASIECANVDTDPASNYCSCTIYENDEPPTSLTNDNCAPMRLSTVYVIAFVLTGGSPDTLDIYVNGWKASGVTASLGVIENFTGSKAVFLGGPSATSGTADMDLAEGIMLKRLLTAQEDADLTSYFETRYGLKLDGVTTGSWAPYHLGAGLWVRGDRGVDQTTDGGAVSAWTNEGLDPNADLSQGTAAYQPTWDESDPVFNGHSAVAFDGTETIYAAADDWWHLASESSDSTWVATLKTTDGSTSETFFRTRQYSSRGGMTASVRDAASCSASWYQNGAGASITDTGSNGTADTVTVIAGVLTGAVSTSNDTGEMFVDGASAGGSSSTDLTSAVAASANREFVLGGPSTTAGDLIGSIAEFIFCKRILTAGEASLLETYMETRYDTTLAGVVT